MQNTSLVPGLIIIPEFIDQYQHDWLLKKIDSQPWDNSLKRRTQHYGWQYRYNRRPLNKSRDYLGELPLWLQKLSKCLREWLPICNQVIVNEYLKGQKIGKHIDHVSNFGSTIITLSLGSPGILVFTKDNHPIEVAVQPCCLAVMTDEARYLWTHELRPVKQRRISITFRQVKADSH